VFLASALTPAPAPFLRLILSKINKFIHFDAGPAPAEAPESVTENKIMWVWLINMTSHHINQIPILFFSYRKGPNMKL
jgi:hypothetical protein